MNTYVMFTDMVGYSKLTGDDQNLALELLKEHDKIIEPIINNNQGAIVKRIGDAIVATFSQSEQIIDSAVEIQNALKKRNISNTKSRQIVIRIGLHYGDVVLKNDEVYGLGYDIASSIEPIGEFGGIAFSQDLYENSHYNDELVVKGSNNHFFVRPVAKFSFKVCPEPITVYKLYLSLLDWYDESSEESHSYLVKQNINKNIYEIINNDLRIKQNSNHSKLAINHLENHNLSLSIYHLQMCLDYKLNHSSLTELQIVHIFCSVGLTRMVDRLCSKISNSCYLDFIKGLNYFNKKEFPNAQIYLEKSLEEKNDVPYILDAYLYLLIIYFNNKDYDKGLNLFSFNDKFFKSNIFSSEIFIIKNIFENFRDDEFNNKLLIEKNILDLDPNYNNQKILFLYWFLIQYYQKKENIEKALIYQDSARTLINNLANKISGYQIKETFNQSPILHQMLMEEIEIIFNSTESSSGFIEIEDSYNSGDNIFKFCTECGFNNQKLFNFCPSCGNKLTK